jgi:hypothetical protein
MTQAPLVPAGLLKAVDDTLRLLDEHSTKHAPLPVTSDPLPSLLEQCQQACAEISAREPEPIRTIHHFACTGGTLICKQLAVLPNTRVLSEVDPLSEMPRASFAPSDLILQLRSSGRSVDDDLLLNVFMAGLREIYEHSCATGGHLVLRDHAHSQFCWGDNICQRDSFLEVVQSRFPVRSVVTIRHPLDSYLSLRQRNWLSFAPQTLEEYSRRYMVFLDEYRGVDLFRYEDFVADPETEMQAICSVLELPFDPSFQDLFSLVHLSGDSGRTGTIIKERPRRPVSEAVAQECQSSETYHILCARIGYDA